MQQALIPSLSQDCTVADPASRLQAWRRRFTQHAMRLVFGSGKSRTGPVDNLPRIDIHRILICRSVRTLGDSLTLTPLLQAVGRIWPGAEVDLVSRCPVAEQIYGSYFGIGRIIRLPAHPVGHPLRTLRALQQMRSTTYDLAIDPDPQSQSGRLLTQLAHKRLSLGFSGPRKSGTLTHPVDTSGMPTHQAMQPVFLVRSAIGENDSQRPYPRLDVQLTQTEREEGRAALAHLLEALPRNVHGSIGVFTDATGDKRFDAAWWHQFVETFKADVGSYALIDILSANSVCSQLGPRYPCFYSGNVRKLAAVLANLSFFVSADCGVMHLSVAAGVPTVGIFKTTDPSRWGPFGGSNVAIDARAMAPDQVANEAVRAFRAAIGRSAADPSLGCPSADGGPGR